jgi:acetyl esterase/lipase
MHRIINRVAAPFAVVLMLLGTAAPIAVVGAPAAAAFTMPAFYDVPSPLPPGGPGTIIKSEPVAVPGLHGTMTRVMYKSKSILGDDIAVTGMIATPTTPAPAGGYKVLSWAHGTTGIADECAPSLDPADFLSLANPALDQGWVIVATDFEGLGTPGRHPYIVGDSEARGTIDIVRAARNLSSDVSADYVVWGHSQGGHAAMFSLHDAASWAPELHLKGVVAGAPPSQLNLVYDYLVGSPYKYYLLMVAAAINAAYGDAAAPLSDVLNAQGLSLVNEVDNGCTGYLAGIASGINVQDLMVQQPDGTYNPIANPTWGPLIAAQDPANFTTPSPAPLLIIHGGNDEQIPTVSSQLLAGQLCKTGQDLERWMYPGQSHARVIGPSLNDMLTWITDRFDGVSTPDAYAPNGQADIDDTICHDGTMITRAAYDALPPSTTPPTTTPPGGNGAPSTTPPAATPVDAQPTFTG